MKTINSNTKKGKSMLEKACYYDEGFALNEVYSTYSQAKKEAWEYCLRKCNEENGNNFHIISHNTFGFSVAWYVKDGVRVETPNNSYLILV